MWKIVQKDKENNCSNHSVYYHIFGDQELSEEGQKFDSEIKFGEQLKNKSVDCWLSFIRTRPPLDTAAFLLVLECLE